ncbi:NAD(P)/FAD-dependent oxidoreductase [Marinitenerispora sediminis]|uniref:FAD-dependent oxidoreductase n=1 Tax=Marinitenerispora sediminis TaxID=1931232 RepID=A0A368T5P1_9ACTN|nr:NAD(P)/FAD-dependent oxidoreductase [Marinitenerispora sediminis]RCV50697.1 FAD-dependent oxidoreductase [Marinitenerispora sediminis]RCV56372.1 FAD-dependent oxidoreductase [Marinitenerispora sediminis]RCV58707.1 FAD-dependent oxidoreductase [Marinitenerispora sediminis]
MSRTITVVGGGLAGLVAAIACAEAGARVVLHEAHSTLGGRGRATPPPYVAHEGAHVFYADGAHWTWLAERGLVGRLGLPPARAALRAGFRLDGRMSRRPPAGFLRMVLDRRRSAPVDRDFHGWAAERYGEAAARAAANAIAVVTYDADTGRLSAAFVWELLRRVFAPRPPAVRWVVGGWAALIGRLADRARELGVGIELDSRVTEPPTSPAIVATELSSARALLGDASLRWESGHCVMLDLAVRRDARDSFILFDMDEGGFHECYSAQDPTVAPRGESLFQLDMPVREGEGAAQAHLRLERLTDIAVPGWRDRVTWSRTATARGRTGAIDLPGFTWRDRPAVERGDGVFLAGDMVAAPGMRGEISMNSALRAAEGALNAVGLSRAAA